MIGMSVDQPMCTDVGRVETGKFISLACGTQASVGGLETLESEIANGGCLCKAVAGTTGILPDLCLPSSKIAALSAG